MTDLHHLPDGRTLAVSADGRWHKGIAPGEPAPDDWHLMTEAEWEQHIDGAIERAMEMLVADFVAERAKWN